MTLTRRELAEIAGEVEAAFDAHAAAAHRPRYNVAPTDQHPVVRLFAGARRLETARWGLPPAGQRRAPLINVRSETARFSRKESFRNPSDGRCLVPADGFYEWKRGPEGSRPFWYHRSDGRLLLLAGVWEAGRFAVLTTTANALVAQVHDRMPAILSADEAAAWLSTPSPELLHPAADGILAARPVSSRVGDVRHDDPACLEPAAAAPTQLSLRW
jgi:putative SOS response-associated peptidase YedK